jgi:hypothetical protein
MADGGYRMDHEDAVRAWKEAATSDREAIYTTLGHLKDICERDGRDDRLEKDARATSRRVAALIQAAINLLCDLHNADMS